MKIYDVAIVKEIKTHYIVIGLTTSTYEFLNNEITYLGLNTATKRLIEDNIDTRNIKIIKPYMGQEVMPYDLIISDASELEDFKRILVAKARQEVTIQQAVVSGIIMYDYFQINNFFADKGFFIHIENKEEIYLKILETEDELMINKLEHFLLCQDKLERTSALEKLYGKLYDDLLEATDEDTSNNVYDEFMNEILLKK